MKRKLSQALVSAFLLITFMHLLVYACVQQVYRTRANEAPTQLADKLAYALSKGVTPAGLAFQQDPELFSSTLLSVFMYDSSGKELASNTKIANRTATVPPGVLAAARRNTNYSVSWAPMSGMRKALVMRHLRDRNITIAVAGPLNYSEDQSQQLMQMVLLSWVACFAVLALCGALLFRRLL
jgi:hypothetical protein